MNTDCSANQIHDYDEKCDICPGYFNEDNDYVVLDWIEDADAHCSLCGKGITVNWGLVWMKQGQVLCQSACDEDDLAVQFLHSSNRFYEV